VLNSGKTSRADPHKEAHTLLQARSWHKLPRRVFSHQRTDDKGVKAMGLFSRMLVCVCARALIAGCGSAPYRSGKGNDHEVIYRPVNQEPVRGEEARKDSYSGTKEREVVYVEREPAVVYQPVVPAYRVVPAPAPAPTYRVITSKPDYSTVTTRPAYPAPSYTVVPVARYYYYD
jgi:hypothetical protein